MSNASSPWARVPEQKLNAVLQAWQGIEPRSDFEQCVWRGIQSGAAAPEHATLGVFGIQSHPAWVGALAASIAIMVGIVAGLRTAEGPTFRSELRSVMNGQTLAASYHALVSGEMR